MTDTQKLQHKFSLSVSSAYQQHTNIKYPTRASLNTVEDIFPAVIWDHIPAKTDGNGRKLENLIESDCAVFDVDNPVAESRISELIKAKILTEKMTNTEQLKALHAAGLITLPDDLQRMFADVEMIIYTSKNNNKAKLGQDPAVDGQKKTPLIPAPRYHVLLPFGETLTREEYQGYTAFMRERYSNIPGVDPVSFKPSQYMDGNRNTIITHIPGSKTILDFVRTLGWSKDGTRSVASVDDIFSQPEVVKSEQAAKVFDDDISTKVRNDDAIYDDSAVNLYEGTEIIYEGRRHFTALNGYQYFALRSDTVEECEEKFAGLLKRMNPPLPEQEVRDIRAWCCNTAYNVKLGICARNIIRRLKNAPDPLKSAQEAYRHLVRKDFAFVTAKTARNVFNTVWKSINGYTPSGNDKEGKNEVKKEKKFRPALGEENLAAELESRGLFLRRNFITREYFIDSPEKKWDFTADDTAEGKIDDAEIDVFRDVELKMTTILTDTGYKNVNKLAGYLEQYADRRRYNPVHEMMVSRDWDGVDRIKILCDKVLRIAPDAVFERTLVKKWLWQTCAMAHNYNGNFDSSLIFCLQSTIGGKGKSFFFARLALDKDDWFSAVEGLNAESKDAVIAAHGAWIIELSEADSTTKKGQSALKGFISKKKDSFVPKYSNSVKTLKRHCSFCATVNAQQFLMDVTDGARRWFVLNVDRMKMSVVHETMTYDFVLQLWAQVFSDLYAKDTVGYRLTDEEKKTLAERNIDSAEYLPSELELTRTFDFECEDVSKWRCLYTAQTAELAKWKLNANYIGRALSKLRKSFPYLMKITLKGNHVWFLPPLREDEMSWDYDIGQKRDVKSARPSIDAKIRAELAVYDSYVKNPSLPHREEIYRVMKDVRSYEYGYFLDAVYDEISAEAAESLKAEEERITLFS